MQQEPTHQAWRSDWVVEPERQGWREEGKCQDGSIFQRLEELLNGFKCF